jgi:hypothetical protein
VTSVGELEHRVDEPLAHLDGADPRDQLLQDHAGAVGQAEDVLVARRRNPGSTRSFDQLDHPAQGPRSLGRRRAHTRQHAPPAVRPLDLPGAGVAAVEPPDDLQQGTARPVDRSQEIRSVRFHDARRA